MNDVTLVIPGDSLAEARIPLEELEGELLRRLAVALFRDGILSSSAACRMTGMEKVAFHHLLGEEQVDHPYGPGELEEDFANWEAWKERS